MEQGEKISLVQSARDVSDLSGVSTSVHSGGQKLVGFAAKGSSSRLSNGLTLVDVDLQFIQFVDVFGSIVVSHGNFGVGVRQLHCSHVAVTRFGRSGTSADLLESSSRTRHIASADSVPNLGTHTLIGKVNLGFKLLDEGLVNRISHFKSPLLRLKL